MLLDEDELRLPLLSPDAVGRGQQPAATASTASRTTTRSAPGSPAAAQRELSTVERYSAGRRHLGGGRGRVGWTATAFCQLAAGFADEPDVAVWRTLVAGLRLVRPPARRRAAGAVPGLRAGAGRARARRPSAGSAAEGEDDLTGELRGLAHPGPRRARRRRRRAGHGLRAVRAAAARPRRRSTPRSPRPWSSVVAATGGGGRLRPLRRALQGRRRHPRSSSGTCTRWPTSRTRT